MPVIRFLLFIFLSSIAVGIIFVVIGTFMGVSIRVLLKKLFSVFVKQEIDNDVESKKIDKDIEKYKEKKFSELEEDDNKNESNRRRKSKRPNKKKKAKPKSRTKK